MKTKLFILMSLLLIGSVLFVSCKESLDKTPESEVVIIKPTLDYSEVRMYEPPLSPGAPGFPTGGGGDGTGNGGGGGGGGGGSTPESIYTTGNYDVSVGALPPCVKLAILDILNRIRDIDSNLDAVLTKFNNNGRTFNYSVRKTNSSNMSSIYGQSPNTPAFTGLTTNGDWITYLNEDIVSNSSQEFIASVFLHEIYHIKLYIDGNQSNFMNHSLYFSKDYVTNIKDDLVQLYGSSSFDSQAALGLALGGVTNGGSPSAYNMTLQDVRNIVGWYQTNDKGTTKCSN